MREPKVGDENILITYDPLWNSMKRISTLNHKLARLNFFIINR